MVFLDHVGRTFGLSKWYFWIMLEEHLDNLCGIYGFCMKNIWIICVVFLDCVGRTFGLSIWFLWIVLEEHLVYLSGIFGLCRKNIWII